MLPNSLVFLFGLAVHAQEQLNGHLLKLDASGRIETWLPNATGQAHDEFVSRAMKHLQTIPSDPNNGLPAWLTHGQVPFYNNAHNPASLFGGWALVASSLKDYTGDSFWLDHVGIMLEYMIANGTTPADREWIYPSVPYASSDPGAVKYRGAADWDDFHNTKQDHTIDQNYIPIGRGDGYGVIEPDKVGMVGNAYLLLYKHDARKYAHFLDAALNCAKTLVDTMNHDANATHSPWPYRVYAETGIVRQNYSSSVLFTIQFFDQVLSLDSAVSKITPEQKKVLQQTREAVWAWMVKFPLANGNWCNYCEDIVVVAEQWQVYKNATYTTAPQCNYDSIQPLALAQYLLARRHDDKTNTKKKSKGLQVPMPVDWKVHVPALIELVERKLIFWEQPGPPGPPKATQPALQYGARCVSEQRADANRMSVHTTRYASTLKQYADALLEVDPGSAAAAVALDLSKRSWAWASYCLSDDGLVDVTPGVGKGGNRTWFSVTVPAVGDTLAIMGYLPPGFKPGAGSSS